MSAIEPDDSRLQRRLEVLAPLAAAVHCSRAAARSAAAALGLSERQVFALVRQLRQTEGSPAVLERRKPSGGRGQSRLAPDIERAVQHLIFEVQRSRSDCTTTELAAAIQRRCRDEHLPPPSISTIRRRLKGSVPATKEQARTDQIVEINYPESRRPRALVPARGGSSDDARLRELLYDTVGNPAGWHAFLRALTEGSYFNRGALALHDTASKAGDIGLQINMDETSINSYARYYAGINPWIARPDARPLGVVLTSEQIISHTDLQRTEYYQDFCRPLGVDVAVGVTIAEDHTRSLVITVLGRRSDLDRDRKTLQRLRMLTPHMLRVAQLHRQLADIEGRSAAAEQGLDRLSTAMLIVNAAGRVVHLNSAANRVIGAGDGLTLVRQTLDARSQNEARILRHLIASALRAPHDASSAPGGVTRISRSTGRAAYEVLVAPVSDKMFKLGLNGPLVAVFVRDPAIETLVPSEWLQSLYSLSGAEARLLQGLLAGYRIEEIAQRFAVTKETLRSQLKAIFLKTGTRSQLALLRLGLQGLAAFHS